jgi:hypothetical protein
MGIQPHRIALSGIGCGLLLPPINCTHGAMGKMGGGVVGSTGMGGAAGGASADPRRGLPAAPAGARRGARPLAAVVLG